MERIKVKVYDKEQKKFLQINWEDEETRYNKGKAILRYSTERGFYVTLSGYTDNDGWPYQVDADILLYTGLKDISRKEIYEGDIVRFSSGDLKIIKAKVEFGCYGFMFNQINGNEIDFVGNFPIEETGLEVIGNIYENPELLEEQANG